MRKARAGRDRLLERATPPKSNATSQILEVLFLGPGIAEAHPIPSGDEVRLRVYESRKSDATEGRVPDEYD